MAALAILLAVALLFAQYVLIDHQSDASEAPCDLCLTAQYQGSTPISKDIPPAIVYGQDSIAFFSYCGSVESTDYHRFFRPRPTFLSPRLKK